MRSLARGERIPLAAAVLALTLVWVSPVTGSIAVILMFVCVAPLGRGMGTRIVATLLLLLAMLSAGLMGGAILDWRPVTGLGIKVLMSVLGVAAAVLAWARRGEPALLPRADWTLVPMAVTFVGAWAFTGQLVMGGQPADLLQGFIVLGWDHQSHFTVFSSIYHDGGLWLSSSDIPPSAFWNYPPLSGGIAAAATVLLAGPGLPSVSLIPYYAHVASLETATAMAILAWVAASGAARFSRGRNRQVGTVVAGLAVGGVLVLGPAMSFFDFGASNFLLAAAIGSAGSWLAVCDLPARWGVRPILLAAAALSLVLIWTPAVAMLMPAGAMILTHHVRQREWRVGSFATGMAALVGGAALWQSRRIASAPDGSSGLADALATTGGGLPLLPILQTASFVVLACAAFALPRGRAKDLLVNLCPVAGAATLVLLMSYVSIASGVAILEAYYPLKTGWLLYLVAAPAAGTAVGIGTNALIRAHVGAAAPGNAWHDRYRGSVVGVAVLGAILGSLSSAAYAGGPARVTVPPTLELARAREAAFLGGDVGRSIVLATRADNSRLSWVPVLWDNGDALRNSWLASLDYELTARVSEVYSAMPAAGPYTEEARDALRSKLGEEPRLKLVLFYSRPESRVMLAELKKRFPDRVRLVKIGATKPH